MAKAHPESSAGMGVRLTRFRVWVARDSSHLLRLMLGSVLCVQLIACANVANLVLARGTRRMREVVVRVGEEEALLAPGMAAFAPAGAPHGVRNESASPALLLVVTAPRP